MAASLLVGCEGCVLLLWAGAVMAASLLVGCEGCVLRLWRERAHFPARR